MDCIQNSQDEKLQDGSIRQEKNETTLGGFISAILVLVIFQGSLLKYALHLGFFFG